MKSWWNHDQVLDQHVTFLHEIIRSNYVDAYVFCTPLLSAHLSLAHPKPCLLPAMVTFYPRFWSSMKLNYLKSSWCFQIVNPDAVVSHWIHALASLSIVRPTRQGPSDLSFQPVFGVYIPRCISSPGLTFCPMSSTFSASFENLSSLSYTPSMSATSPFSSPVQLETPLPELETQATAMRHPRYFIQDDLAVFSVRKNRLLWNLIFEYSAS